jgi:glycerophosphoryl diester phosphodiesterase
MNCNSKSYIDIQGHRGFRGLYPENTLLGFEKAIAIGVHTLEFDIAITKDQKVVVSHEPYMNSEICLKPNGDAILNSESKGFNLYEMTYDEIKQFDCGSKLHDRFPKQQKIKVSKPLLVDVFELAKAQNPEIKFNIEIKSQPDYYGIYTPKPKDYVRIVLDDILKSGLAPSVNLQSFDITILEEIKKQSSKMPVALLVDENESISDKLKSLSFEPEIISPYFKLLDRNTVTTLKEQNFMVIPWTVNSKSDMLQMVDYKVHGIITDYPDLLVTILKDHKRFSN